MGGSGPVRLPDGKKGSSTFPGTVSGSQQPRFTPLPANSEMVPSGGSPMGSI
jgi:hypothetical protein